MRRPAVATPAATAHAGKRLLRKQPSKARLRHRYTTKRPLRPEDAEQHAIKRSCVEIFPPLPQADVSMPLRKIVYLLRGPPGCGKSTAARHLLMQHLKAQSVQWQFHTERAAFSPLSRAFVLSTDDYFTEIDDAGHATYSFNSKLLGERHKRNQLRCEILMELGLTPLFVDNTNIALWEMRAYLQLADRFHYAVEIINPRDLAPGALNPAILHARLERDQGNRAHGKAIDMRTLERMSRNFEELPCDEPLQAIRDALAPWERKEKLPLYAGLDTEARTLAALGAIELGPSFWGTPEHGDMRPQRHLLDARYWEDPPWMLPDRLHVTVRFFGGSAQRTDLCEAEKLIGTWHEVMATALVFIRGGGILCAAIDLGNTAESLREIAGPDWWPHVTLLTSPPWRPVDSTLLLQAWDAAKEATPEKEAGASSDVETGHLSGEPSLRQHKSEADVPAGQLPESESPHPAVSIEIAEVMEQILLEPTAAPPVGIADPLATSGLLPGGETKIYSGVMIKGRTVDLCVIPLNPPRGIGPCQFRFFS